MTWTYFYIGYPVQKAIYTTSSNGVGAFPSQGFQGIDISTVTFFDQITNLSNQYMYQVSTTNK